MLSHSVPLQTLAFLSVIVLLYYIPLSRNGLNPDELLSTYSFVVKLLLDVGVIPETSPVKLAVFPETRPEKFAEVPLSAPIKFADTPFMVPVNVPPAFNMKSFELKADNTSSLSTHTSPTDGEAGAVVW